MKKRLIKGLLMCAFATGVIVGGNLINANASTLEGYVTASTLNVRDGQSIHSHKIGQFQKNAKVKILSVGTKWDKVQYGNKTGYVYNEYIRTIGARDASLNAKGHIINISSSLRVRNSASTNSSTKGYLRNGQTIDIVAKSGNWYKIKYNGNYGYVYGDYVSVSNTSNSKPSVSHKKAVEKIQKGHIVNISSSLRVRSSASTNSNTKGYLRNGQSIDIVAKSGNWYKIKYNGSYGYVYGDYVKVGNTSNSKPSVSHKKTVEKIQKGHIVNISSSLRVRSSASTNSNTKGYLRNGQSIDIVAKSGNWYKIKYNGSYGYVYGDYVKVGNTSNNKPNNKPITNTGSNQTIHKKQTGLAGKIAKTKVSQRTNQIILVVNNKLTFWNKDKNGNWNEDLSTNARLGYGGLTDNKHEGDGATPTGAYPILYGFGFGSNPGTRLEYKKITNNSYFVDDVNSKYYNQWHVGKGQKGEHMIDHPQYKYGMVIGYNTNHKKGKGSAIFLHCNGRGSTAGCVSVPESTMLKLLKSTHEGAYIIITSSENNLKYY